ncbi:serine hydrolase domain-containing protein [Pedobacter rhodius]|uniref:Serine hydrolase n=1 Tax=Pedobacter rhodius TaxID=3004098 RepID=A0ABT4KXD3_9SPHI|nr:serine hydrolase domain-containing protein [Pedobacter sp. SJ11]MCZ4222538.1 serine hydrolase [Pedobacter sp. SJ11]
MKNYCTLVFIAFLLLGMNVSAQQQPEPSLPPARIDSMLIDLNKAIVESHMPGLMISIVNRSGVIYAGGIGYSNLAQKSRVTSQTVFRFASVTKMFTALAIEKLISEGKFKLDDPIKKIAPEIPFENAWEKSNPVRVVHLLEHTAGFEDVQLGRMMAKDGQNMHGITVLEFHKNSLISRWKPGERMSYANPGYEVLGYLIEKFSGMKVNEYLKNNILLPIGMKNSAILTDNTKMQNLATAYHFNGNDYQVLPEYTLASNGAAGNLVSCADDISKYLISLLNYYQSKSGNIIPEKNAVEMDSIHSSLAAKNGLQTGYALGNAVFANNKKITFRGHEGLGEGFSSWIFYNRKNGIAYAIANNSGENNWRISQIIESFITRDLPPVLLNSSVENLDRFREFDGYYALANPKNDRWDFLQKIFNGVTVRFSNQKIILKNNRGHIDTLVHVRGNLFRIQSEIIPAFIFSKDENGTPFLQGYNTSEFFTKVAKAPIVIQQYLFYAGLLSILIALILGFVALILLLFKKINYQRFFLLALPALAGLSGLLAYRKLSITDEVNKIAFSSINATTLFIFFTSLSFGFLTIISLILLIKQWNILKNKFVKITLTFTIIMLCYLTGIFILNGWIGVRIWAL